MYNENPIFRSLSLIEERIHEKLTVEVLADSMHLSKYYYQRLFHETVGDSVMRYVTRRKLALAAKELENQNTSILEIALQYGYDSHEGFTRSFRSWLGVTPTEYRKYHQSIASPTTRKENPVMSYANAADEMIRELNELIVQAKETVVHTRKSLQRAPDEAAYAPFWEFILSSTDAMADDLTRALDRITSITRHPDEISARFLIIKALDDAVFRSNIIAFQAGLTMARAPSAHCAIWTPICEKYKRLASNAQTKAGKVTALFQELSDLIFRDMKAEACLKIQNAVAAGKAAAAGISVSPYTYIADEIRVITNELSSIPLEEINADFLDDLIFRLDIIAFAADVDTLHTPSCIQPHDTILQFRECIAETAEFFRILSSEEIRTADALPWESVPEYRTIKQYRDLAFQGNILLFYLRGEIQKLGHLLDENQQYAFAAICETLRQVLLPPSLAGKEAEPLQIRKSLRSVYTALTKQAQTLGIYGAPIDFIADEIGQMGRHL